MTDFNSEGWSKILEVFPDIDFTKELEEKPELSKYLAGSINQNSMKLENPLDLPECPKLDEDFSKYILLNGLPKCDEAKAAKLTQLIIKLFQKSNFTITDQNIEMNWGEDGKTTGQAFIQLQNEEQAKISASIFNGHVLDSKHTFSACTIPDFEKIMAYEDKKKQTEDSKANYLELNSQILDSKKSNYVYQTGKNVIIKSLHGQNKVLHNLEKEERKADFGPYQTDKPVSWSPKGTYLVIIKSDKVEFVGGSQMEAILYINQPKVESVLFSPCEKYILLYSPKKDMPYSVWNFLTLEKIREFEQNIGEDANTFKWSYNGEYIAKQSVKKINQENEGDQIQSEPEKTCITVYELPSMKMQKDPDGNRTSILIDGLADFVWAPHKNVLVYSSFPAGENSLPRVSFMELPKRENLHSHTMKDSQEMKLYFHPQGTYLAIMNRFTPKKTSHYSIELFETNQMQRNLIPHQQIVINREVQDFHSAQWEPFQGKIAIHYTCRKVIESGHANFSNETTKTLVDVYQIKSDTTLGFHKKFVGTMNSDKIQEVYFSGVGNILSTVEQEGLSKFSLNFYLIQKIQNEGQATTILEKEKGARALEAAVDAYEFRKIARHEIKDKKYVGKWDQYGRYFMIYGRKTSQVDKQPKNVRFYNMFGELLDAENDVLQLDQILFRPRSLDILDQKTMKWLKKEYKKKYEKLFKEEEAQEKKVQNAFVKEKKKVIRDDFLNNFFIPLRQEYEKNIKEYQALFPIKESDMSDKEATYYNIYQYGEVTSQRKLEI